MCLRNSDHNLHAPDFLPKSKKRKRVQKNQPCQLRQQLAKDSEREKET